MKTRIKFPEAVSGQLLLLGFGLAVVYWFLEAATDAFVFRKGPFIRQLVPQEPNELWMRMLMAAVLILFSIYAHFVVRRRRNAEKAVREARRRLQNIFTSMTDPVFVVGRDATIQSANPAACSLMGYTEEEFRGMPVGKLFEE
ncbi:MAG: PAS domain S-box protein, partial [Fidelibacterota bacterium]